MVSGLQIDTIDNPFDSFTLESPVVEVIVDRVRTLLERIIMKQFDTWDVVVGGNVVVGEQVVI